MPAPLRIHLTPEEDARLRELETNPVVPFKVRRRAQAVRLAAQGWTAPKISQHLKAMGRPREAEVQAFSREEAEAKRGCGRG
jgi:hypothetical protein